MYIIIPEEILKADIKDKSKLLFGHLLSIVDSKRTCCTRNSTLAKLLGLSKSNSVSELLKELENIGAISTKLVYKKGSKQVDFRRITLSPKYGAGLFPKSGGDLSPKSGAPIPEKRGRGPIPEIMKEYSRVSNIAYKETKDTLSTPDGVGGGISSYNFTDETEQMKELQAASDLDWLTLKSVYKPAGDNASLNNRVMNNQKKIFSTFSPEERAKIIGWFQKYKKKMETKNVWLSTFFNNRKTIGEVADFFRELRDLPDPKKEYKGDVKNNFDPNRNNY